MMSMTLETFITPLTLVPQEDRVVLNRVVVLLKNAPNLQHLKEQAEKVFHLENVKETCPCVFFTLFCFLINFQNRALATIPYFAFHAAHLT